MPVSVDVKMKVPKSLLRTLRKLQKPEPIMKRFLTRVGIKVQSIARKDFLRGPRPRVLGIVSGDLARSITVDKSGLPDSIEVGSRLVYAPVHEFGLPRKGIRARPFISTALDKATPEFAGMLRKEIERVTRVRR